MKREVTLLVAAYDIINIFSKRGGGVKAVQINWFWYLFTFTSNSLVMHLF